MTEPQELSPAPSTGPRASTLLVTTGLVLLGLWAALPWAASRVIPMLAADTAMAPLTLDVRRIGPFGLDLAQIAGGPQSSVRIKNLQVDWSVAGLLQGKVDDVRVVGLEVQVRETGGKWEVPCLTGGPESRAHGSALFLPGIERLAVDGRGNLDGRALTMSLPFAVNGSLERGGSAVLDLHAALSGQDMQARIQANLADKTLRLSCSLPDASIAALTRLIPGRKDTPTSGWVQVQAELGLDRDGRPRVETRLEARDFQAMLGADLLAQEGNASAQFAWQEGEPHLIISPVRLRSPLPVTVALRDIRADVAAKNVAFSWGIELGKMPGLAWTTTPRLAGQTSIQFTDQGFEAQTTAELGPIRTSLPSHAGLSASLDPSPLRIAISSNATATHMDANLALDALNLTRDNQSARLADLNLRASASLSSGRIVGTASLDGGRLEANQPGARLTTNSLGGQCAFDLGDNQTVSGVVSASARAVSGQTAANVSLRLPLAWPAPSATAGQAQADLQFRGKTVARGASSLRQSAQGIVLDGTLSLLPVAVRAALKGLLDLRNPASSWVQVKAGQSVSLPGNLAQLAPTLKSLTGSARLDLEARWDTARGGPSFPVEVRLSGATLTHGQTKTTLTNANLGLAFPDLLAFRSAPAQRLHFDRLQLGSVVLEKGDLRFQFEALHSILIEGCHASWAGGRVGSHAFRIDPGTEDYTVELYCDRVQLAQALSQFGMTKAQGGGTANGRIPVRYSRGSISFDDGFLYSTPGENGVLRIPGTEMLTAGVPPDSPQFAQLDLASEALKDFAYEWAKVGLNTQDQELLLALQLDGRPTQPLPFAFNRDIGGFTRVTGESPGSTFQGIRLDVNFRLPLDQLLQYRKVLQLMKNGG